MADPNDPAIILGRDDAGTRQPRRAGGPARPVAVSNTIEAGCGRNGDRA